MIHQSKSFIKFVRLSKNKHGVHSPFVYNLVTKCFNDKTKYTEYEVLKQHRQALRKDTSMFEMKDFGQGSRVFKGNARKVSAVLKNAGMKKKQQKLLFRLAKYFKSENILELGTSLGLGTVALSISNEFAAINTVEGCPNTLGKAQSYFEKFNLHNIAIHQQLFSDFLSKNTSQKYDLIFIDGDHNGERTLGYFNSLLKNIHNDSVIIFDDIYWSKDMTAAWQQIITHEKVTVSIDTFQWGLVFFRKEQRKEHFIIRV
ncbi:putative O-methyltransferase [Aequorivita sublithincola DSM 14238]|uniref:Putative O-methyltransferase n=1 Tax=Aequorivita sublithincola (strain DSM 14238 / LMG 21431 / ACAM 643 / 9-3) TaxID=746697 RepID=I3YXF9_AEQSU|nr:class I SAM-dependent methyltransferase [Aequorivita sublithincola]AFL81677.1 putative O-methyltransferase [Aequorivita sublithincola DSM 14238]